MNPIARWRIRAANIGAALLLTLGAGTWVMSTDELDAFASALVHQVKTVHTNDPGSFVVVRTTPSGRREGRAAPRRRQPRGVDRDDRLPARRRCARSRATATSSIPAMVRTGGLGWIHTSAVAAP